MRVEVDSRSEKVGKKIREAELAKIPYLLIVGEKEQEAGSVAVRQSGGGDQTTEPVNAFVTRIQDEVETEQRGL